METIRLEVNKKIYDKLIRLLDQFPPEDLKIINEDEEVTQKFLEDKKYLQQQLDEMDCGSANFITLEELDDMLEKSISKHEGKNT